MTLSENQEKFVYWITERWEIRKKREAGLPAPWTTNKVLQENYFCNVNREDDKVTKWIRQNWKPGMTDKYELAMITARLFNKPSTLAAISIPTHKSWLEESHQLLLEHQREGFTIFNGAYIVSTNGKKMNKIDYMFSLLRPLWDVDIVKGAGLGLCSVAHKQLMEVEGLASFMAAQVVADLKNSVGYPLHSAKDKMTFSAFGPGSLRGLSWFWENKIGPRDYDEAITQAFDIIEWELPSEILNILCMQNLQNCFCEYDKFMRVTNGTGRSKRKYNGR